MDMIKIVLLVLFVNMCLAHEQVGNEAVDCDTVNKFQSYHIHTLFWPSSANSTAAAEDVHAQFLAEWSHPAECDFKPKDIGAEQMVPCTFEPDYAPAGPFLTGNFAYFIPISYHEKMIAWFLKQKSLGAAKNKLDLFVHPNSGCSRQDHTNSALWGGNKWELDVDSLSS